MCCALAGISFTPLLSTTFDVVDVVVVVGSLAAFGDGGMVPDDEGLCPFTATEVLYESMVTAAQKLHWNVGL
jgi:hypothetical protein